MPERARSGGTAIPEPFRTSLERSLGFDFGKVRIFSDADAGRSARDLGADAYTVGNAIVFAPGEYKPDTPRGLRLLAHELVHTEQQRDAVAETTERTGGRLPFGSVSGTFESEARAAEHAVAGERPPDGSLPAGWRNGSPGPGRRLPAVARAPGLLVQRSGAAATKAITRGLAWLARRGTTISRHVARHTRHIAGRAVHTVFRKPTHVKKLVHRTLKAPDNVVTQPGRRLRYVVEKQFGRVIGKNGETILHVVVEASGRIVTAYPVRAFTRAAGAAALVTAVDASAAEAQPLLDELAVETEARLEAAQPSFLEDLFWDIVTFGLHGGSLNVGEDVMLWAGREEARILREACDGVIAAVENDEQRSLGVDERAQVCDLVTVAIGFPGLIDQADAAEDAGGEIQLD